MQEKSYINFDLLIEKLADHYRARVLDSPAGEARIDFDLPLSGDDMQAFFWLSPYRLRHLGLQVSEEDTGQSVDPKEIGTRLFNALFSGDVGLLLQRSLDEARRKEGDVGLRIRLRMDEELPELADLPWEFCFDEASERFLALSLDTPLVRYIELPLAEQTLAVAPPLKVLAVVADPNDVPELAVEREWQHLQEAMEPLQSQDLVELERLPSPTLRSLQRHLRRHETHILHYVGHGYFNEESEEGGLVMENSQGLSDKASAGQLGMLLQGHRSLRLAFLNACEGAQTGNAEPFAGVAQKLVQQGVPAVLAMQFAISDEAALTLASEFYVALVDGYPVDAALTEPRKAISIGGNAYEWATPVLFSRSADGYLISLHKPVQEEAASVTPPSSSPGGVTINIGTGGGQISDSDINISNISG